LTTLSSVVSEARSRLSQAGFADAAIETRILIGGLLGLSSTEVFIHGDRILSDDERLKITSAVERRLRHEPVHRILGRREFYGLDLTLSADTLEPRPDTEVLVETLLPHLERIIATKGGARMLDMGTGTGAICLALLKQCPLATGIGSDIAPGALETALRNAGINGVADRFSTCVSDWFANIDGRFDIIVSNPPYIRSDVIPNLDRDVREFDPMAALDGGSDGLDPYRSIALDADRYLEDGGVIGVEIGFDQREDVGAIFQVQGYRLLACVKDYGGNDRVMLFGH
jgi:release factor glutamine methyltransferase